MAMEELNVNRDHVKSAAASIEESSAKITGIQTELHNQVLNLTRSGWTGNASARFLKSAEMVNNRFVDVQKQLDTIHVRVSDSHTAYVKREQTNQDAVAAVDATVDDSSYNY